MQRRTALKKGSPEEQDSQGKELQRSNALQKDNVARLGEGARLAEPEEHHTDVGQGKNINASCVYTSD